MEHIIRGKILNIASYYPMENQRREILGKETKFLAEETQDEGNYRMYRFR